MSNDNLITCPRCGSDACYEHKETHNLVNRMCYGCGFMTHNYMKEDSEFLNEQLEVLPELYKSLTFIDDNGYYWIPSTVNLPDKGMVYVNGSNANDWRWTAVPAIEIPEDERERFPIKGHPGEYHTHKMDNASSKDFKERDYMEALDYIDVFKNLE
jgi:hypothetical protein|tara:strand:+ start:1406 stop:1873 length:468 start_codon:yes stop_codon:yes gene_type:complete